MKYKILTFEDNPKGRQEMSNQIDILSSKGWEIKSKEVIQQGWDLSKTCCLGALFLPLALLGKKDSVIHLTMQKKEEKE